jgi:hypothetical protein
MESLEGLPIMSIEIKQLMVKSNVVQKREAGGDGDKKKEQAALAKDVLEQCRNLILEIMDDNRDR